MANFIVGIISLTISAVILANVFITTLKGTTTCVAGTLGKVCNGTEGYGTNTTGVSGHGFSAPEIAMWGLITLVSIVGLVYGVLNIFGLM